MNHIIRPATYAKRIYTDPGLTPMQRLIAGYLSYRAMVGADPAGWFKITQDDIAESCGINRKTVGRALPDLIADGWLAVRKTARHGRWTTTHYRLLDPGAHGSQSPTGHGSQSPTERDPGHAYQSPNKQGSKEPYRTDAGAARANGAAPGKKPNTTLYAICVFQDDGSGITCTRCGLPAIHPRHLASVQDTKPKTAG